MTQSLTIPTASLSDWLSVLKPYQREIVDVLLVKENQNAERAAEKWLTATGATNIIPFGGVGNHKPFWDNFKSEFIRFLCDKTAYTEIKAGISNESPLVKTLWVSVISSAIGAKLGYAATLLAPAVALLLSAIGKISLQAYCKTNFTESA